MCLLLWWFLRIPLGHGNFNEAADCYVAVGDEAAATARDADEALDDAVFGYSVGFDGVDEADGGEGDGEGDGTDWRGVGFGDEEVGGGFDVDLVVIHILALKLRTRNN